ncbi:LamG-like jellyroll fold domain-containing protein [Qingshengfaniella alkalisoli]|uniref:PKD domain-containing protein n=1 Tax=Qingshengfaniella alkalisoli TaxID=2599296 RepID=A0A5B8J197_9RHOB|nr:LamG-like jellyroll fold domain-containing protein [Qingshengfaniella alkalisoli]QDY70961.1 hypothetical protein FPZ52_14800 [Qingshengfaniella alkalisoli]
MSIDDGQTILVRNSSDLDAAVRALAGTGGAIQLDSDAGPYWIHLKDIDAASEIVITSSDPTKMAEVHTATVIDSKNLSLRELAIVPKNEDPYLGDGSAVAIYGSSDIRFEQNTLRGIGDGKAGIEEGVTSSHDAILIRDSKNVTASDNTLSHFWHGITVMDSFDTTLSGNNITKMQGDIFRLAGADGALLTDNKVYDLYGSAAWANHDDIVQFWGPNINVPNRDITISGNYFNSGDTQYQGIYGSNVRSGFEFTNFVVENNLVVVSAHHGISINGVNGVLIRNNTVLDNADSFAQDWAGQPLQTHTPYISANGSSNVTVTDNVGQLKWSLLPDDVVASGNLGPHYTDREATLYIDNLFTAAGEGGPRDIRDYMVIPGSAADGLGAPMTWEANLPEGIAAIIRHAPDGRQSQTIHFMAYDADPSLTYRWSFSDGSHYEGSEIWKLFAVAGPQTVTLDTYDGDLLLDSTTRIEDVYSAILLDVDFEGGIVDASGSETLVGGKNGPQLLTVAQGPSGSTDTALNLQWDDAFVIQRDNDFMQNMDAFSLALDLRRTDLSQGGFILGTGHSIEVYLQANGALSIMAATEADGKKWTSTAPTALDDTEWHRISFSYDGRDGSGLVIRIDDSEVASLPLTGELLFVNRDFTIGSRYNRDALPSQIDNIRMVDYPTSNDSDIYNTAAVLSSLNDLTEEGGDDTPPPDNGNGGTPENGKMLHEVLVADPAIYASWFDFEGSLSSSAGAGTTLEEWKSTQATYDDGSLAFGGGWKESVRLSRDIEQTHQMDAFTLAWTMAIEQDSGDASGMVIEFPRVMSLFYREGTGFEMAIETDGRHGSSVIQTDILDDGDFHKMVMSYTGDELVFYGDGEKLGGIDADGLTAPHSYHGLHLGSAWNHSFDGRVDDFLFADAEVTASQVAADHDYFLA